VAVGPLIDHREDGNAALRMIWDTLAELGPPGTLPSEEAIPGPRMVDKAAVICEGLKRALK
jgi:hypothetical protein